MLYFVSIMFITSRSSWLHPEKMSVLLPQKIKAFLADDNKCNRDLRKGYQIAIDSTEFVRQHRAFKEPMEKARVDQLESENDGQGDDDGVSSTQKSKKRK